MKKYFTLENLETVLTILMAVLLFVSVSLMIYGDSFEVKNTGIYLFVSSFGLFPVILWIVEKDN